ncbi:MAG: phosphoenolpyruvate--protein phosphotransferase [Anaerolineae bacterium]|nr:phosphoenolpyruvate--protein phosphotransferase [Anaerolineae bacterium]
MVGLVIVSHSARLAEGVRELAEQMTQGRVPLAVAGGIDDADNPIGTDAMKVMEAIDAVYSDDGVVILMDLGSALLSAETALDFLPDEQRANVFLSKAPLVEGAMAAAVQAMVGAPVKMVLAEAESALAVKREQLGGEPEPATSSTEPPVAAETGRQIVLRVRNRLGLHARPAARFVTTAGQFAADIRVTKGDRAANAKSINQVATLGVRQGDEITIICAGPDAAAALAALQALADDNFGDRDSEQYSVSSRSVDQSGKYSVGSGSVDQSQPLETDLLNTDLLLTDLLPGIPASPGVAVGPAAFYRPRLPDVVARQVADPAAEWQRLQEAVDAARAEIDALHRQAVTQVGRSEAAIFEAHQLFLSDPTTLDAAREIIFAESLNAEAAWQRETNALAATFAGMEDEYMRARAADIEDISQRVLRRLLGVEPPSLDFAEPSVLIATDLTPSDTARLDPKRVLAICTELGGATGHSAILARALGIPAIVGLGPKIRQVAEGQRVAVDGDSGALWLSPDETLVAQFARRRDAWQDAQRRAKAVGQAAAVTRDGHRVEIAANIGGPRDATSALEFGAEGVGLFRTEFLFMDRPQAPTEEEQLDAYRQAARHMRDRPLIIRTLDVGGDKPLPYLDLGEEANPFLGWRAIRFCLERPDIFMPQLRAILRASHTDGAPLNVKVMFPMIGTLTELCRAKEMLETARRELREEGLPFNEQMEVGIMIEVPSAVAVADQLAREVDFFSIGTNDLTQYVMAADRGNARVSGLASAFQPAVLRMIRDAAAAAHEAGIWIGMCGELAGNPLATPVLLGLGLDELSMSAPAIPAVKEAVRNLTLDEARRIAGEALAAGSAEAVMTLLGNR